MNFVQSLGGLSKGEIVGGAGALRPQDHTCLRGLARLVTPLISLLVLLVVVYEIRGVGLPQIIRIVPASPAFWAVFAASYIAGPVSEWIIFRRLWGVGFPALWALLRKLVYNELLVGYLGEAYFYTWARGRVKLAKAPFADVKDVTILSAVAGNLVTTAMLAVAWPLTRGTEVGAQSRAVVLSLSIVLITSVVALVWRRKIFSLPAHKLRYIFAIHVGRILLTTFLSALLWHLALKQVPLTSWLLLASIRLLVSRLPFLPNKDVLFAGLAVIMLGHDINIGSLMTLMAGLILLTHLLVATALIVFDLVSSDERRLSR